MKQTIKNLTLLAAMIITAATAWAKTVDNVKYIDENGVEKIANSVTELTGGDVTTLNGGWYVVNSNITYTGSSNISTITLARSDVHLILADGCQMNVGTSESRINDGITGSSTAKLTIYGQTDGTGALNIYTNLNSIYTSAVTINGGNVNATGQSNIAVYATSGDVTINGGQVTANGSFHGIYASNDITINGGQMTVNGDIYADNNITLGWKNATDFIKASSYYGTVKTATGQAFVTDDNTPQIITGTVSDPSILNGKKLSPCYTYLDENGKLQKKLPSEVTVLTGGAATTLPGGWYVAKGEVSYTSTVTFNDDVHLILADGGQMNIGTSESRINDGITGSGTANLTIYGQTNGTGALNIYASKNGIYAAAVTINGGNVTADVNVNENWGIAVNTKPGDITINGGTVNATATGNYCIGLYAYSGVIINGGNVNATGAYDGIRCEHSDLTINGGIVEAHGDIINGGCGINACGYNVTINGGQVTATGKRNGINTFASGDITLGWKNTTDFIKASSYNTEDGSVKTADGKRFLAYNDAEGAAPSALLGSLTSETTISDRTVVNGKTLRPLSGYYVKDEPGLTVSGKTAPDFTISNTSYYIFKENDEVTLTTNKDYGQNGIEPNTSAAVTISSNTATAVTFAMPAADINGVRYYNTGVDYMDWDDTQKKLVSKNTADITPTAPKVYILTGGGEANIPGGWYVAKGEVSYTGRLTFHGEAHLILADGCNMTVLSDKAGVEAIFLYENLLSVYSQSGGTGSLTATGTDCGISAGDITINGGQVTATSSYHGINTSNDVIINGGIVTANGNSNGILADKYVTINGGQVSATGTRGICANQGDITLGWSKSTDFIKTNKYSIPSSRSVKTVAGKPFIAYTPATDNDPEREAVLIQGKDGGVTLDKNAVEALAGKVLRPAASNDDVTVKYLDAEGTEKSTTTDIVYVLQGNTNDATFPPPGWHVAKGEVSYTGELAFNLDDEVHLILADGCQMNFGTEANPIESNAIYSNKKITIYGQANGTGTLNVYTNNKDGIHANGDITINGGQVTASATGTNAKGIYAKNITLGWSKSTDFIKASSYQGKVKTAAGKRFVAYNDEGTAASTVFGDLTSSDLTALAGKTLRPSKDFPVSAGCQYAVIYQEQGDWKMTDPDIKMYVPTGKIIKNGNAYEIELMEVTGGIPNGLPIIVGKEGGLPANFSVAGTTAAEANTIEQNYANAIEQIKANTNPSLAFFVSDGVKTLNELINGALGAGVNPDDYIAFTLIGGKLVAASNSGNVVNAGICIFVISKLDVLSMIQGTYTAPTSSAPSIVIDLGNETGITTTNYTNYTNSGDAWYTLDGRKLDKQPTQKGVYVNGGRKVVIR